MDTTKHIKVKNQIYNWFVKNGNIQIQKNEDCVFLKLEYEKGKYCIMTLSDTNEIIELLTNFSKQIWENPDYVRVPYTKRLYQEIKSVYVWTINTTQFCIRLNEIERAIEVKCDGNSDLNIEVNYVVEIIQVLEHLKKYCA